MIKKIGIILLLIMAAQCAAFAQQTQTECPPECVTDTMVWETYYPSPYGLYEELRGDKIIVGDTQGSVIGQTESTLPPPGTLTFNPLTDEPTSSDGTLYEGSIYYDKNDHKFKYYDNNNSWKNLGGGAYWDILSGNDIYNTNSGNVQIGSDSVGSNLKVYGSVSATAGTIVYSCPDLNLHNPAQGGDFNYGVNLRPPCVGQLTTKTSCNFYDSNGIQTADCTYVGKLIQKISGPQTFTSDSIITFPSGTTTVLITLVSAGGGGAGAQNGYYGENGSPGTRLVRQLTVTSNVQYGIHVAKGGVGGSGGVGCSGGNSGEASSIHMVSTGQTIASIPGGSGGRDGMCSSGPNNVNTACLYSAGGIYCDGGGGGYNGSSGANGKPGYVKIEY